MTTGENFWLQIQNAISGSVAAVAMAGVSKAAVVVIIVRKVLIVVKK